MTLSTISPNDGSVTGFMVCSWHFCYVLTGSEVLRFAVKTMLLILNGHQAFLLIRSAARNRTTLEHHAGHRRRSRLEKSPKDLLVGTWVQVSLDTVAADGTRRPLYGENAKGMIIYTSNGYFTLMQASVDLPKLKSGLPSKATPEEAKAVIANSIAYFGKYALDETSMVLSLDIQASTFANLTGNPLERRNVTSLTNSELRFNRPFVKDVTLEAVFKRAD
jgi:hypothetical protein